MLKKALKTSLNIDEFSRFFSLCCLLILTSACTESDKAGTSSEQNAKPKEPWVMELHVIPTRLTINPEKFYSRPFTVRAKYSNATVINVSKQIQWVSENLNLLSVNKEGELVATGDCKQEKCPVFLVGTDPASGKSVRVTVNIKPKKLKQSLSSDQVDQDDLADQSKKKA
ncbi:MAG: hypothetical protein OEX07_03385 [Gammaproteobacteria bacterium]|nr:hypothetical protein [Gammaproteobacteria bacterium]